MRDKYLATGGGPGTYTRPSGGTTWTKQTDSSFVAVTGISGVPTSGTAGTPLALTGTVAPANATNKTIVWSVKSAGTTGATISGNTLTATASGTVTITATIANGKTASTPYTQDFTITIQAGGVAPGGTYIITGSGTSFTATDGGATIGTGAIQDVINAIRSHATGKNPTIQFGNGTTTLDIGEESVNFNNSGGTWGMITLTGKITSAGFVNDTIHIDNSVSVTSKADIAHTPFGYRSAIYHNSTGTLTISGGTVTGDGRAVYNSSNGTVSISGGTLSGNEGVYSYGAGTVTISGGTVTGEGYAVYNESTATVSITGGTVSGGIAVYNNSTGKISVSGTARVTSTESGYSTIFLNRSGTDTAVRLEITGGTVENTCTDYGGHAVENRSTGAVMISGGTVSAKLASAVVNRSTGKITVSGTARVTSATPNTVSYLGTITINDSGTDTATRLEITGGTVENTSTSTGNAAVYSTSPGTVSITGGTVSKAGDGNYAVRNGGTGKVTIGTGATIVGNNYGVN